MALKVEDGAVDELQSLSIEPNIVPKASTHESPSTTNAPTPSTNLEPVKPFVPSAESSTTPRKRERHPWLRYCEPYWHPYRTSTKQRWLGRQILEVVSTEFRDRSVEYYVSPVKVRGILPLLRRFVFFYVCACTVDSAMHSRAASL